MVTVSATAFVLDSVSVLAFALLRIGFVFASAFVTRHARMSVVVCIGG